MVLIPQLSASIIVDSYRLHDSEIEAGVFLELQEPQSHISTVSAVMFAVGEGELLCLFDISCRRRNQYSVGAELSNMLLAASCRGGKSKRSLLQRFCSTPEMVQAVLSLCADSPILNELEASCVSRRVASNPGAFSRLTRLSINSLLAILLHKVAASILDACIPVRFRVLSWMFGFLLPMQL